MVCRFPSLGCSCKAAVLYCFQLVLPGWGVCLPLLWPGISGMPSTASHVTAVSQHLPLHEGCRFLCHWSCGRQAIELEHCVATTAFSCDRPFVPGVAFAHLQGECTLSCALHTTLVFHPMSLQQLCDLAHSWTAVKYSGLDLCTVYTGPDFPTQAPSLYLLSWYVPYRQQ